MVILDGQGNVLGSSEGDGTNIWVNLHIFLSKSAMKMHENITPPLQCFIFLLQ